MTAAELLPLFRTRYPEFASVSDDEVLIQLGDALCIAGSCGTSAILALAAHLLVLDKNQDDDTIDGGNGETTSESVGSVSVSMKSQADTGEEAFYTSTKYGRRYLILRRACRAFSVRVG